MTEGGNKKKPLDIIDHMTEHLSSYEGRYLVIPGATGPYPSYYPYLHQPFLYHQQLHPHYYTHRMQENGMRGYGGGSESGGCLIENMVGNWSPDLTGTYSPFGGGVPPQPPPPDPDDGPGPGFDQVLPPGVASSSLQGHAPQPLPPQVLIPGVQNLQSSPQHQTTVPKKQRIVAEVKPLRPSYSDVVSKSSAPPPSPATKTAPVTANNKVPSTPSQQPPKDQTRPKTNKQTIPAQPNFSHTGGKECKKENICEDIFESKKKKGQDWNEGVKGQDSKQSKQYTQTTNKKNKQTNKQAGRDEKSKCVGGKSGSVKGQSSYYPGVSDVYKKYVAASDDEQENDDDDGESDEEEMREPTPPPRQRLHHSESQSSRKHTGVKVERAVNSSRAGGKSKRSQRASKRKENKLGLLCKKWQEKSSYYLLMLASWLINLLLDVLAMSAALLVQLGEVVCRTVVEDLHAFMSWLRGWWSKGDQPTPPLPPQNSGPAPLQQNIQLPTTGEEAMKRLLSCKGKDPYSILGLTSSCTDEEIRRYYRSQALLVHPDKNSQPGAEEAFKILVHAFDLIAEPEKRAAYDRYVSETNQVEQAWSELSDLLTQLHEKMHYAATTIRCNNCGKRHKRTLTERPVYAARYCAQCNIHHSAKEGDMWCEVGRWLFSRRYLACMEGSVYEITEWARCQGGGLADLVPHAHSVHYRVLLGGVDRSNHTQAGEGEFDDLLSSIYGQSGNQQRHRMNNRRKGKKSK